MADGSSPATPPLRGDRRLADRAGAAWADDAKLDALVEVPWGKIPGRFALAGYVQEILAHGWDRAKATGPPARQPASPSLAGPDKAQRAR